MNKNKLFSRLAIFIVGVPLTLFLIWLPFFNHLALHILMVLVTIAGSLELHNIFSVKVRMPSKIFTTILAVIIPFIYGAYLVYTAATGSPRVNWYHLIPTITLILCIIAIFIREITHEQTFDDSSSRIAYSSFLVFYTGYLITFIQQMSIFAVPALNLEGHKNVSTGYLITFILIVYLCDSSAWLFGNLFGKNNKGILKASPNKSIAGFMGGIFGAVAISLICYFTLNAIYKVNIFPGSIAKIIVLGFLIGFSAIIGDLTESILKRSSGVKDSGKIIMGRGGILDSIDSIVVSAPVFYLYSIIFFVNF